MSIPVASLSSAPFFLIAIIFLVIAVNPTAIFAHAFAYPFAYPFAHAFAYPFAYPFAYHGQPTHPMYLVYLGNPWKAWSPEPGVIAGLTLLAFLYCRGALRVRRQSLAEGGVHGFEAACFATCFAIGWMAVFIALVSPLGALGETLFSARLAQHGLLVLVAAPMLAMGRPLAALQWALPAEWRRRLGCFGGAARARILWRTFTTPLAAWLIHAAMLWLWHTPPLFQLALKNDLAQSAQHLSLLVSAFIFCDALNRGLDRQMGYGAVMIYVFTACVHTTLLGALLADASTVWYSIDEAPAAAWGLTPLEDQRLGGLILCVSAGVAYAVAGLILLAAWLRESKRKVPAEEKALLLDTDVWNSREWLMTHRDRV